jgi:polysaccharide export outer membrane protein
MFTKHVGFFVCCLAVLVAGCSGAQKKVENAANRANRASTSSDRDRQLALETLARLPEQKVDYRIGASDVLEVGVFEWELSSETKTLAVRVSQEGVVSLPLVGDLVVKGKTVRDVRVMIEKRLKDGKVIINPRVSVVIKEFRSKRIAVVGAVKDPGTYTIRQNVTRLLDILSLAGGVAETAGQRLQVVRTSSSGDGAKEVITVDLHELLKKGDLTFNVVLADGDVINVPLAQQFFVYGYVQRPGAYDLKRRTTVLEAIAISGGFDRPMASPSYCMLKRGKEEIDIDLVAIAEGEKPDYYLRPDDIVEVRCHPLRRVGLILWQGVTSIVHVGWSLNN